MVRVLLVAILALSFSGCIFIGATSTAVGTAVVVKEKQKQHDREMIDYTSSEYLRDHANSPCTNNEDTIMPSLVKFIKDRGSKRGVDEAIKRLESIYNDGTQSDEVRASSLYHIAVLYFRREDNNPYLGVSYLKKIHEEFPGHYDCIFADTPWRQYMIEKLEIPDDAIPQS